MYCTDGRSQPAPGEHSHGRQVALGMWEVLRGWCVPEEIRSGQYPLGPIRETEISHMSWCTRNSVDSKQVHRYN